MWVVYYKQNRWSFDLTNIWNVILIAFQSTTFCIFSFLFARIFYIIFYVRAEVLGSPIGGGSGRGGGGNIEYGLVRIHLDTLFNQLHCMQSDVSYFFHIKSKTKVKIEISAHGTSVCVEIQDDNIIQPTKKRLIFVQKHLILLPCPCLLHIFLFFPVKYRKYSLTTWRIFNFNLETLF